ncbi:hypothetical protein PC129_g946 [Phytophthora cactorum]|uniref:Transposase putative helix-turn-helix domain-containing protein n=1 Tax=Phytophthora cactorum TaxID=29920 RepID=A0A8T0ZXE0_9STRA|nr:hypothetical protein PC113_g2484 [Phytophthora cactorum]KAG2927889.1 hypothetical protein PC114_g3334 [Phytophthora cactorum]KAG2941477.1 hypothetical protein PC115_g1917 [Phytophthora cactorum]KAG2951957.1 hypothetical protein PC117_g3156 [Phytophthora cactorum]KAG3228488.1 hypothetical protein PC129_g946 [Phytophthora cactorum]
METPSRKRTTQESPPKKRKKRREKNELLRPRVWFKQEIASILWMPQKADLVAVRKPRRPRKKRQARLRRRKQRKRDKKRGKRHERRMLAFVRDRVPESQRVLKPPLTSWFDVDNLAQATLQHGWRTNPMLTHRYREIAEDLQALDIAEDETANSMIKIRLFPTREQKEKLDQMFAAQRAIYNKIVARSRKDRATRLTSRDEAKKMTMKAFGLKYRPISKLGTIGEYFRNKRGLKRHKEVQDKVRDYAYRDFMKATKSSIAGFFAALKRDEKATYPDILALLILPANPSSRSPASLWTGVKGPRDPDS